MNTIARCLVLFGALFISESNFAEGGCPPGMYPPNPANTAICYPLPNSQKPEASKPVGYWQTRYAAVAIGKGAIGASTNKRSKQSAETAAKSDCKMQGGKNCRIVASFYNQCGVVAWGVPGYEAWTGPNLEDITQSAMSACKKSNQDCKVYYSSCVEPVWVQR